VRAQINEESEGIQREGGPQLYGREGAINPIGSLRNGMSPSDIGGRKAVYTPLCDKTEGDHEEIETVS
jgi:hypothetical protein